MVKSLARLLLGSIEPSIEPAWINSSPNVAGAPRILTLASNGGTDTVPLSGPESVSRLTVVAPLKLEPSGSAIAWPSFLIWRVPDTAQFFNSSWMVGGS
jgi:hypothetical protein